MNSLYHLIKFDKNSTLPAPSGISKATCLNFTSTRYERCVVKEGDLALYIDSGLMKGAKIPMRAVLTNRTFSIYSVSDSLILSRNLATLTGVRAYTQDHSLSHSCFAVEVGINKTILCSSVSNSSAQEWVKDILDFTKSCNHYYSHELDYQEMKEINSQSIQNALDFYNEQEKEQMEKIITTTQKMALQAIEKEREVENMIEKEQEEKEKKIEATFQKELEKLQSQSEIISSQLEQKKKQAKIYENKKIIKQKIQQITEQVKQEVIQTRMDLKNRMTGRQKDLSRKAKLFQNRMNELKNSITKELLTASKNGSSDFCDPEQSEKEIVEYCQMNYHEDINKMNECVRHENYCYMCCEAEFGDLHLEERINCYSKCDDFYIYHKKFELTQGKVKLPSSDGNVSGIPKEKIECPKKNDKDNKKQPSKNGSSDIITEFTMSNLNLLIEKTKKLELLKNIKADLIGL